jgi:hypothetical protein
MKSQMKAFPIKGWNGHETVIYKGMDLRDYFAAKIITAFIPNNTSPDMIPHVCEAAYKWADAMMIAREQK